MNIRRRKPKNISLDAIKDLQRVYTLWTYLQERKNSSAPFLLGEFSMVDAYFAPVVSRIISYELDQRNHSSYIELISTLDSYKEWEDAAYQESWVIEGDE
jgi:glutathione S-transferase